MYLNPNGMFSQPKYFAASLLSALLGKLSISSSTGSLVEGWFLFSERIVRRPMGTRKFHQLYLDFRFIYFKQSGGWWPLGDTAQSLLHVRCCGFLEAPISSFDSHRVREPYSPPVSSARNVSLLNPFAVLWTGENWSPSFSAVERIPGPRGNNSKSEYMGYPPFIRYEIVHCRAVSLGRRTES